LSIITVINPKYSYLKDFIENLPGSFDKEGETFYDQRNILKIISINNLRINVKSFKVPDFPNRYIYGTIRQSKAKRSFAYATILQQRGINTPEPIAYIENKKGLRFQDSYYLSVHEDFDGLMREFRTGKLEGRENLLSQFARFTADMHEKEVLHEDYSPGNILYKKTGEDYRFYLVDLNRMYFGKISMNEGCRSLRRLWGNDEIISYIATEYAKARGFDPGNCVQLTLDYHKKFWSKLMKRHPGYSPYIEPESMP